MARESFLWGARSQQESGWRKGGAKVKVALLINILQSLPTLERSPISLIITFLHAGNAATAVARAKRKRKERTGSDLAKWHFPKQIQKANKYSC